jgi:hypothetical protein
MALSRSQRLKEKLRTVPPATMGLLTLTAAVGLAPLRSTRKSSITASVCWSARVGHAQAIAGEGHTCEAGLDIAVGDQGAVEGCRLRVTAVEESGFVVAGGHEVGDIEKLAGVRRKEGGEDVFVGRRGGAVDLDGARGCGR